MSAIAAVWHRRGLRDSACDVDAMLAALRIYGADRSGSWRDGDVALAAGLMVNTPEDAFDRQPLTADGLTVVATARLDNRAELVEALDLDHVRAREMPDVAFIHAAYRRWGEGCPTHLLGDFSFAVWDHIAQKLVCARDHMGRHPLVYHSSDALFALASMPKGLFALPEVPCRLDEAQLVGRLRGVSTESSFYDGVRTVPAGHTLVVRAQGDTLSRYWTPQAEPTHRLGDDECVEAFKALFDEAVRSRLRGVGEVASHVSGGFDSAAVTVTAARLLGLENRRLTSYTAAPREHYAARGRTGWPWDESGAAALVARRCANVDHIVLRPDGSTMIEAIRRTIALADRAPIGPGNAVWDHQINADAQRRGVRTLLTGQMGNLTISHNGMPRLHALARAHDWIKLAHELRRLPLSNRSRAAFLLRTSLPTPVFDRLKTWFAPDNHRVRATHPDIMAHADNTDRFDARATELRSSYALRATALFRVDLGPMHAASQAGWRIDSRDPTADPRIVDFCLSLPEDQYLRNGTARWLFRRAFARELPPELLAPDNNLKGRQAADYHEELAAHRDEYLAQLDLIGRSTMAARYLDLPYMKHLLENLPTTGWNDKATESNYRAALLRGLAHGMLIVGVEAGHG